MSALSLEKLRLINFRSYEKISWSCEPGINIIYGPNGVGKTNLLESIGYLGIARSFRQKKDQQLINWGHHLFKIKGNCIIGGEPTEIEIVYQKNKKELTINGFKSKFLQLLGIIPVIYFGPDDLNLLKGAPAYRRNFLDREISILDKIYCRNLQEYRKILLQRNDLLKSIKEGQASKNELEPWNIQLIDIGTKIIKKRSVFLNEIMPFINSLYQKIGRNENLSLIYKPNIEDPNEWRNKIAINKNKEIQTGNTLWGPHRDDFSFYINNYDARNFASQGQQRTAILVLKIAEAQYFEKVIGKMPILLFDDVFSELDEFRQCALLDLLVNSNQAFITTAEINKLPQNLINNATIWEIYSGKICKKI
ncbi:MAG: replication and repair protein RecF [Clostridia bacterium]|nr:replication and repair protein RecF [Clostridia bacterium]